MEKKPLLLGIFLAIAILIVLVITVFQKIEVFEHSDLNAVSCGWPMKFVVQDESWRDPPFPWKVPCGFYGEDTTAFHVPQFILDVGFFYVLLVLIWEGCGIVKKKKYIPLDT